MSHSRATIMRLSFRPILRHSNVRPFSSCLSRCQQYIPPPYEPTASTELDEILETIRRKVLLPKFLDTMQRKFVRSPKNRQSLLEEDIRVVIGGHEERLEPFDITKDYASMRDTFTQALTISADIDDFSFWPSLIRSYYSAGYKLSTDFKQRWVRKALENDKLGMVMQVIQSVNKNNLTLTAYLTALITTAIRNQALVADQLYMVEHDLPEVDHFLKDSLIAKIRGGDGVEEAAKQPPELSTIRAKAFQRGLARSLQLNMIVTMDKHSKALVQERDPLLGRMTLAEPILVALPLEFQSRLQAELKKAPDALSSPTTDGETAAEHSDNPTNPPLSPKRQLTADDYAARLLHALSKQPIDLQNQFVPLDANSRNSDKQKAAQIYRYKLTRAYIVASSLREAQAVIEDAELAKNVSSKLQSIEAQMEGADLTGLENHLGFDYWKEYNSSNRYLPTR